MNDRQFLLWVAARLVHVYHESELTDFVCKLRAIAVTIPKENDTKWPTRDEDDE